jgi:DNA repair/transcription protein MET18/MMS19
MLTMAACFPVYGVDAVKERGTELWEGIKTEVCRACQCGKQKRY